MSRLLYVSLLFSFSLAVLLPARAITDLTDGSFEDFDDTWQCDENCIGPVTDYIVFSSYAVEGVAYAYIFHDAGIYQDFVVPTNTAGISFWYDNQPDDLVPEEGSFTVSLIDIDTSEVYTQETFAEQSDIWIEGTINIPDRSVGKAVRLQFSNTAGFNRIDALEFSATPESLYASANAKVFSSSHKKVKHAEVFIKYNGNRVSLLNLKTNNTVQKVKTNKKGKSPKFMILKELGDSATVKLCVKKMTITECSKISPATGAVTTYEFTFENTNVK